MNNKRIMYLINFIAKDYNCLKNKVPNLINYVSLGRVTPTNSLFNHHFQDSFRLYTVFQIALILRSYKFDKRTTKC